jgi:hypothetical protein
LGETSFEETVSEYLKESLSEKTGQYVSSVEEFYDNLTELTAHIEVKEVFTRVEQELTVDLLN